MTRRPRSLRRATRVVGPLLLAAALLPPPGAAAQTRQLVAEAGASSVLPPVGLDGDAATYLLAGLRAEWTSLFGDGFHISVLAGRTTDSKLGGDFVSGEVTGFIRTGLADAWSVGWEGRLAAFAVSTPYPYRAGAMEGQVDLRFERSSLSATLAGIAGWGRSRVDLFRYADGPVVEVTDDLWRYGGTLELLAGSSRLAGGASLGHHTSAGGTYRSLGGRVVAAVGPGAVELRVDRWDTPVGAETTGGIALAIPLGGWSIRGFLGRSEPDPLTLAEPGRGGGGLLLGLRLAGGEADPLGSGVSLHRVLDRTADSAHVRFRLDVPSAAHVELLGDFTFWEPVPMARTGNEWTVEVNVAPGTYHFGFNVDGEWYLPDDAPDAVPDEWGRRSATLVVEG